MSKLHADVLSFGEIGGVGEMTYRTVRFPRYELVYENGQAILHPQYVENDKLTDHRKDTLLTGQELLASLCNLYRAINDPACKGNYIEMITDWCSANTHPYNIDALYDLASAADDYSTFASMIVQDGTFSINDFMRDLEALYHTMCFYHALVRLIDGDNSYARALHYEGRFSDGYPFFEKYKQMSPEDPFFHSDDLLEEMEHNLKSNNSQSSLPAGNRPFLQNPLNDLEYLHTTLLSLFPEFRMKLRKDSKTNRIMFAADVYSVFDLAWYTLSRAVAQNAPEHDMNPNSMFSDRIPQTCQNCGNFFVRTGPRQRYCTDPVCQAARQRKNQRNKRERDKLRTQ